MYLSDKSYYVDLIKMGLSKSYKVNSLWTFYPFLNILVSILSIIFSSVSPSGFLDVYNFKDLNSVFFEILALFYPPII